MFDIEEITNKWVELGFLEQLSEQLKPIVALKYELTAHCLIDNDEYVSNTMLQSVIFPIIYRIYKQGKTISNVETFVRQVYLFFVNNREIMRDLSIWDNVDVELEMCAIFAEQYKGADYGIFKPVKWVAKHKL